MKILGLIDLINFWWHFFKYGLGWYQGLFSSASRTPPELFIFVQQQTISNQLLRSVIEARD